MIFPTPSAQSEDVPHRHGPTQKVDGVTEVNPRGMKCPASGTGGTAKARPSGRQVASTSPNEQDFERF